MTFLSALTDGDFAVAVQRLLPRGRAWPRFTGTVQQAVAQALADCLFAFHQACVTFLENESFPETAQDLLPDFLTDYGLPDGCSVSDPTVLQNRNALLAKIAASPGGQSASYYMQVATQLGYSITITTWSTFDLGLTAFGSPLVAESWRLAWKVSAPTATIQYFQLGNSRFGEPFWTINNTELQCRMLKIAPAYGLLWFHYS